VFLGYRDSGMAGENSNHDDGSFWGADLDEAAARLAAILAEEAAEVLTVYDDHGGYHHPDHVQVHRVGVRAAELAGTPRVYEATADRDHFMTTLAATRAELGDDLPEGMPDPAEFADNFSPAAVITTRVDVGAYLGVKRAALATHASQIDETSFFLTMPDEVFAVAFGTEWFIRRDAPEGARETWLFD
jgi:LmbE family N-acetylglucosaminyl deacetylase